MPSRHYIVEKGIPALHTKVREQVQRHLKEATSIALTTDLWSSGVAPMSLLILTAHWIDSSFTLHNVVLHASELRGSHTSMRIRNAIEEMLAKWDIDNDKVHVVMRDNAANMKKAFADMGVQSLGCFAHTLQLVVIQGGPRPSMHALCQPMGAYGEGSCESTDAGIKTMKRTLLEAVTERFDYAETEPIYSVATLVDPRYKDRFFTSPDHQELAKEALIREVEIMERKRKAGSEVSAEEPPRKSPR
ncbi:hypothetical protein KUCAC02_007326 [Chaenocephalus aceratus]|uniref:Uncharacterized protein n=1 Tax=Chaenocephalus aceratus TaxID=36190 RepID=A0ACB9X6G1_CHAAC|nr:hypothetical protein KUCAC02_007326 [Chaenocephalus aceratus]